jgi:uncharacterized protein
MDYYNPNIKEELSYLRPKKYFNEWYKICKPILLNDEFQRRKLFKHHDGSVWDHTIKVSYQAFIIAKKNHFDAYTCAIAGLLHDFYPKAYKYSQALYDLDPAYVSRVNVKCPIRQMHGFVHAREAADNALKYFPDLVTEKVYSCIKTHMFPLNTTPPRYLEGWIVTYVDKMVSTNVVKEIKYLPGYVVKKVMLALNK